MDIVVSRLPFEIDEHKSVKFGAIDKETFELLGMASVYKLDKPVIHVDKICVNKGHRGRGVGASILKDVLQYGHEQQKVGCSLSVSSENREALSLYEGLGFKLVHCYDDDNYMTYFCRLLEPTTP